MVVTELLYVHCSVSVVVTSGDGRCGLLQLGLPQCIQCDLSVVVMHINVCLLALCLILIVHIYTAVDPLARTSWIQGTSLLRTVPTVPAT